jgi:hypothetical protein
MQMGYIQWASACTEFWINIAHVFQVSAAGSHGKSGQIFFLLHNHSALHVGLCPGKHVAT